MAQAQAGTVIGGVMLARSPQIPRFISAWMFGVSASKSRNRSWGDAQSSPMIATLGVSIFDQTSSLEYGYVRVAGILSFSLALLMVLVARRLTEIWWFAWAFVVASAGSGIVAALNALLGLPDGASPLLWWLFAAASTTFAVGLLAGLAKTGTERPPF